MPFALLATEGLMRTLVRSLAITAAAIVVFLVSIPTAVAGGGYPHDAAQPCGKSAWCVNGNWLSARGYGYKNCTDWAAWRLQQMGASGASTRGLGNGGQWASRAGANRVSTTPAVGRAAVQPSSGWGHVAIVEAVHSDGRITVSEYNYSPPYGGRYGTRTGRPSALGFSKFVDFGISRSGYQMAFQANTGNLVTFGSAGNANTGQGMLAGTSPGIARAASGYQMAFQANTGNLITFGSAGNANTGQGMLAGTSPGIAASGNGFKIAFQANNGRLYTYSNLEGARATDQGMKAGTSPAIGP